MRVATEHRAVQANPGESVDVVVEVVNTSDLIDGFTAGLIGLPDSVVDVEPKLLPLFPDARGQIRLAVQVPTDTPAGLHPLTVEIVSHAGTGSQHVNVDLSVSASPAVDVQSDPRLVRARRSARFLIHVANTGNTALDVTLDAEREDRRTAASFTPQQLTLAPGTSSPVMLRVRGPRMFTGGEVERAVGVEVEARRVHAIAAMAETETETELRATTTVILRQRPLISRGLLTALILASIVALWALAFLLGLSQVFSNDPMTKTAPTSFPTSTVVTEGAGGDEAAGGTTTAPAVPAGALPKTGLVPPGVGGAVSGVVTATSNQEPVGRILVQAYRTGRRGPVLVSSAATQSDGSYTVAGLFPTGYHLKFSAKGYKTVWHPTARARSGSTPVRVGAQSDTSGINAVIEGRKARIVGTIEAGESLTPPATTVVARLVGGLSAGDGDSTRTVATTPTARTVSDAAGRYTLADLPAPGTYELSFAAPGYQVTKVLTNVSGGETRLQPGVVPSAGSGSIAGTVTSGSTPLGNVTVSTTVVGETVSVTTPTVGAVGAFSLGNLPTPGTYVVQFAAEGHGSVTRIVGIDAGGTETGLRVNLAAGSGSVSGRLVALDGTGLGGATVTVGGAQTAGDATTTGAAPTTTTLTSGTVGAFSINGLATPGEYTLTFELEGYAPETVPVSLAASGSAPTLQVELGNRLGRTSGRVTGPDGTPYVGANVAITDGRDTWTATSTAPGGALRSGGYLVANLPPGTYSVTVTADGLRQQTAMVTVYPGINSVQNFALKGA